MVSTWYHQSYRTPQHLFISSSTTTTIITPSTKISHCLFTAWQQNFGSNIPFKVSITINILPTLEMFHNIDNPRVLGPYSFYSMSNRLNNIFKSISEISSVLIDLSILMSLLTKFFSSLLSLTIICYLVWICSLNIEMVTISSTWSETSLYLGCIKCLSSSSDPYLRNIKLMTEFKL